jgi:hypothetical protein
MFIETAANAQELNAAIERIADAVGAFILLCVYMQRPGEVRWWEVEIFWFGPGKWWFVV